jgi:hypothetical protein
MPHNRAQKTFVVIGAVSVACLAGSQFVRPPHGNPRFDPTQTIEAQTAMPPQVATVLERGCRDCHSDTTVWRWYANIAPVMWLQAADVWAGRAHMNLSEWGRYTPAQKVDRLQGMCRLVRKGEMPLWYYEPLHPAAWLSSADKDLLCDWTSEEAQRLKTSMSAEAPAAVRK